MPKTLRRTQLSDSQKISSKKKGGKFILSSDDVTDEMRLARELGIFYKGQANLEDKINDRLSELGISMDFTEEENKMSANFGATITPASLNNGSSFSYSDEVRLKAATSLNSLNTKKISNINNSLRKVTR